MNKTDLHRSPNAIESFTGMIAYDLASPHSQSSAPTPYEYQGPPTMSENEESDNDCVVVTVSAAFHQNNELDPHPPDTVIYSSDQVMFWVHRHRLASGSLNSLASLLPMSEDASTHSLWFIPLPENSLVLNIALYAIYGRSCPQYVQSFHLLAAAVDTLDRYGFRPGAYLTPSAPLYAQILSCAPLCPVEAYTIAAKHQLEALAVSVSSHLLSVELSSITDEAAMEIGPIYLKRLLLLHNNRLSAFQKILVSPPYPHPPTKSCNFVDQRSLNRAWSLASAQLLVNANPDLPIHEIQSILGSLRVALSCPACIECLNNRIQDVVVRWSLVERTI